MKRYVILLAALLPALGACGRDADPTLAELPALGADGALTVSGVSSGAYMAGQFHVAYAADVSGAGLIAGGPWGCAAGKLARALGACISGDGIDVAALVDEARAMASSGGIAALAALAGDRVYLFHGSNDATVGRGVVQAAADWYRAAAADVALDIVDTVAAAHGLPTLAAGAPCAEFAPPYLNACDYDLAGALLGHLYGELRDTPAAGGELIEFRQQAPAVAGLAGTGYAYVPAQCRADGGCRVHVFFHGCGQAAAQVGRAVVDAAGFNAWAAANDIVVLYPQVAPSSLTPQNPLACWDWWGYSGADYLSRNGAQLAAIRVMTERLARLPGD